MTLLAIRQALAARLDDLLIGLVQSATTSTIVVSNLVTAAVGASATRFNGSYGYISTGDAAGQQRRVRANSYVPAGGMLTFDPPFSVVPTAGSVLELTHLFPADNQVPGADTSYRQLINAALSTLLVPDELSVPITTADRYSLASYSAWLDRPERVMLDGDGRHLVLEPSPVSQRRPVSSSWRGWRVEFDGSAPLLTVGAPFASAGGSLTVKVLRPASTLISGGETTGGFGQGAPDAATCLASLNDVVDVALAEAYLALWQRNIGHPNGIGYRASYEAAQENAERLQAYDHHRFVAPAPAAGAA